MGAMKTTANSRRLLFRPELFFQNVQSISWTRTMQLLLLGSAANAINQTLKNVDYTYTWLAKAGLNAILGALFFGLFLVVYAKCIDLLANRYSKKKKLSAALSIVFYSLYPQLLVVSLVILSVLMTNMSEVRFSYFKEVMLMVYILVVLWSMYIQYKGVSVIYGIRNSSAAVVLLLAFLVLVLASNVLVLTATLF
jgi:hypothetical protein